MKILLEKNDIEEIELTEREEDIYRQGRSDGGLVAFLWAFVGFVVMLLLINLI